MNKPRNESNYLTPLQKAIAGLAIRVVFDGVVIASLLAVLTLHHQFADLLISHHSNSITNRFFIEAIHFLHEIPSCIAIVAIVAISVRETLREATSLWKQHYCA